MMARNISVIGEEGASCTEVQVLAILLVETVTTSTSLHSLLRLASVLDPSLVLFEVIFPLCDGLFLLRCVSLRLFLYSVDN